jgi:hypothetical protein
LFEMFAPKLEIVSRREAIDYVIATHYRQCNRPFRFCQPRDLLLQIRNYCSYHNTPPEMTPELFDRAVENYFAVM